jgi:tripartite-type tricarboxylate transporter receptor subunit TctC
MKLSRRKLLHLAAGAAAMPAASRIARAQAYPTRQVRWIVGFSAGGLSDIVARLMAQWLTARLGQPFLVENRPGAATNIATEFVVRAPADGYTLLMATPANATSAAFYNNLNFNFIHDIAAVAGIIRAANVMAVHPSVPATSVPEFIAYAKANPGKLNFASAGNGTNVHLIGELFKLRTGLNLVHVPYRGSAPALTDMISGRVQLMFDNLPSSIEYLRAGKLRALAVTTATRSPALPDIPTMGDFIPGFEASVWQGVGVPRNTPPEIIEKLNTAINAALADPTMRAQLAKLSSTVLALSPAEFGALIADETEKWGHVIRAANLKPEQP